MQNRAGREVKQGVLLGWSQRKQSRGFFSPLLFEERGSVANHTHTLLEKHTEEKEERKRRRTKTGILERIA